MIIYFINIAKNIFIKKTWLQFVIIWNYNIYIIFFIILTEIMHITFIFKIIRQSQDNIIYDKFRNKLIFSICYSFIINDYILV